MSAATRERAAQIPIPSENGAADPTAPSANSLAEILKFDTVPRTKFFHTRWKRWVHLRAMDAGSRRETDTPPDVIVVVLNVGGGEHRLQLRDASSELEIA